MKKTTTNNKYATEKDKICTASGGMRGKLGPLQFVLYTSERTKNSKQARGGAHDGSTSQRERPHPSLFHVQAGLRRSSRHGHVPA